jgi:hypothetical protein
MFYSSGTFSRKLCRSVFSLLCMLSGVCAAQQNNQFLNVPQVEGTGGQVASFLTGTFQQPPNLTDILYINAPVVSGTTSSITVGELLNGQGFTNLGENQIAFTNVSSVVAAVADFDGDGNTDYAFALTPTVPGGTNLCVYYGTGATVKSGGSSYNGGNTPNAYPPTGGKSGCLTFPSPGAVVPPKYTFISAPSLKTINGPQLIIEDSANNIVTILANGGTLGNNGALTSFSSWIYINLSAADGAGPIYAADLNGDGNTDLIINCQTSQSALVYFGDGSNNFSKNPVRYTFGGHIHSMLLQDMDGDGHPDMVVEADNGVIEIFHGNPDGTFASTSEGGTVASVGQEGYIGDGGHLAAINPFTRDILVTTPIGLSVLQGSGSLSYSLKNIYNIGPGRTSFAMADFFGTNRLDFAVDSPEGVAIVRADTNGDGGFQTSNAYPALQPALGTTVGKFRNSANNPKGNLDVVAATGAIQAQLLTGNGDGTFNTLPSVVDSSPNTQPFNPPPPGVWSNVLSGDFDGDGNLDVLYSLTGLPQPPPSNALALYIQYGIGDGTFDQSGNSFGVGGFSISSDGVYLESAVGDVNGDGVSDEAISDAIFDEVALGIKGIRTGFTGTFTQADSSNTNFSQVAAGFFKTGRTNQQDVVFQQGSSFIPYVNKQDGTGIHFTAMPALTGATAPLYASTALLTDVDGDGNGDLVVAYYNTAPNAVGAGPVSPNQLYIWWGNGDGTFASPPLVLKLSRNYYLGAVADMNGDGRPDIVLSDGSLVSILYNQGSRSFGSVLANGELSGEAHFLAGQGINSLSIADVNGDGAPDLIVANGGATISNAIAIGGKTASSISLTPNPDVNTGGITVLLNSVNTKPLTGSLIATPEPSNYGATFTLTATLTPTPGVAVPTGTVQFFIDGVPVGAAVAVVPGPTNSTATYVVPAGNTYAGGTHTLSAAYSGDTVNSPLVLLGTHFITAATTSPLMAVGLAATPEPSVFGAGFILTATLTSSPGVALPTGVVTFFIDGVQVGTGNAAPVPGSTTTSSANFPIPVGNVYAGGSHALSATYSGDAANSPTTILGTHFITATTTTALNLCVGPTLACPSNGFVSPPFLPTLTMIYGQTYNGTATVTASDGGPLPGNTLIYDAYNGAAPLLLCTLATQLGGSCPPSVGIGAQVGTHIFTAVYAPGPGDTHTGSTSPTVTIVVTQDTTTATLVGVSNPSPAAQPVIFTATLTGNDATPTGTVVFTYGATVLGQANLIPSANGFTSAATLTTSALPVGTDVITATYAATLNFAAASASFTETITPSISGTFTLTVTPTPVSVGVGYATLLTVAVTGQNGFAQALNLTCSGLPTETTCFFDTPQIAAGGGTTELLVQTTAPHSCGTTQPYFLGSSGGPGLAPFALAGLLTLFLPGRRRWLRALVALLVVTGATQITGCGNCTDLGTRPNTYTFTVTASSAGTSEVQSQLVTITVTI